MRPFKNYVVKCTADIIIAVVIIFALATDEIIHPRINVPILYIIPIAFAALRWRFRAVLVVIGVTLLVALIDQLRRAEAMAEFSGYLDGILIVSFVATVLALQRERMLEEARHRQQVIENVERLRQPLTVILGYAQLLQTKFPAPTPATEHAPVAITQAARRMRQILSDSLANVERPGA
jgi:signal transduction histidine kinase